MYELKVRPTLLSARAPYEDPHAGPVVATDFGGEGPALSEGIGMTDTARPTAVATLDPVGNGMSSVFRSAVASWENEGGGLAVAQPGEGKP